MGEMRNRLGDAVAAACADAVSDAVAHARREVEIKTEERFDAVVLPLIKRVEELERSVRELKADGRNIRTRLNIMEAQ